MTRYKSRDVVLVDVKFSDGTGVKKRPALIISSEKYHQSRREVIIAAITSNVKRVLCGDTKIKEWEKAGLIKPSLVAGVVQTITSSRINKKLGVLAKDDFQSVLINMKEAICL